MSDALLFCQCVSTFIQLFHDGLIQFLYFHYLNYGHYVIHLKCLKYLFSYIVSVKVIENAHYLEKSGKLQFCYVGIRLHLS